jgi:hypothetical protein
MGGGEGDWSTSSTGAPRPLPVLLLSSSSSPFRAVRWRRTCLTPMDRWAIFGGPLSARPRAPGPRASVPFPSLPFPVGDAEKRREEGARRMADTKPRPETSQPFVASRAWTCVPGLGGDLVRVGEGTNGGHDRGASSWMDGMEPNDFAVRLSHFGYHHTTSLLVWSQHHRAGDSFIKKALHYSQKKKKNCYTLEGSAALPRHGRAI